MNSLQLLILVFSLCSFKVSAHPVAQGSMVVTVEQGILKLRVHASVEQMFVANHFEAKKGTTLEQSIVEHSDYIQKHLFVEQDHNRLAGRLDHWERSGAEHIDYDFIYTRPHDGNELTLRQDFLNEINFAPGNPWEATYQVITTDSAQNNQVPAALLTSKNTVQIPIQFGVEKTKQLFTDYVEYGVRHIIEGTDHLLFTSALVLGAYRFIDLFRVVTAFTLAHSLTLTLSVLDLFRLTSLVVEPMIALSIIVVAILNILTKTRKSPLREVSAGFFGLFHGLGFSGGLLEIMEGLPSSEIVVSLLGFTAGVELGQQVVILPLFIGFLFLRQSSNISTESVGRLIGILSTPILIGGIYFLWVSLEPLWLS